MLNNINDVEDYIFTTLAPSVVMMMLENETYSCNSNMTFGAYNFLPAFKLADNLLKCTALEFEQLSAELEQDNIKFVASEWLSYTQEQRHTIVESELNRVLSSYIEIDAYKYLQGRA